MYQVYAADVLSEMRRKSDKGYKGEEDVFSEYSTGSIEAGQRLLWCQLPSVRDSGVLESLEPRERKRQEVYKLAGLFLMIKSMAKRVE